MSEIKLHSRGQLSINELKWASQVQKEDKDYLLALLNDEVSSFISNIKTSFRILQIGNRAFPLTVNEAEYDNAYTCSPYTQFISYGRQELYKIQSTALRKSVSLLIDVLGPLLKAAKINKVACVNNWLLSTNLYPHWEGNEIGELRDYLKGVFPEHAIVFRSLNHCTNASLIDRLQNSGFRLIPSREIFIFDQKLRHYSKRRNTIIDFKLLEASSYQVVEHHEITAQDYPRIVELYSKLYTKYSTCSPAFIQKFIRLCHEHHFLKLQGIRNEEGRLIAILGSFARNGVLATPLVGYDIDLPLKDGLFRKITALAMKEAHKNNLIFNISAGVSEFKRLRGAVKFFEYDAVYCKHLSRSARFAWNSLQFLMTNVGIPLLNKFNF